MKNFGFYIAIFLMGLSLGLSAQVLEPFNKGLNNRALSTIEGTNNALFALTTSTNGYYQMAEWQNEQWELSVEAFSLPKNGVTSFGEVKIINSIHYNHAVYFIMASLPKGESKWQYQIIKFASNTWTDISNKLVQNADELVKLLKYNGNLVCISKNTKDTPANIFYYDNEEWVAKGNYITPDVNFDLVIDAVSYNDRIYVSGVFTKIGSIDKRYMAEWNGTTWNFVNNPPFIKNARVFGELNNSIILYGIPTVGSDFIKVYDKSNWQNLSNGLADIEINDLNSFAYHNNMIWACGKFTNKKNSKHSSLMYYLPSSGWQVGDALISNTTLKLAQYGQQAVLYGDFQSFYNQPLNHIASLSAFTAMLRGSVYVDSNKNCIKEPQEDKRANIAVLLNPGNHYFMTNSMGEFSIPVIEGKYTLKAVAPKNWDDHCSAESITVNQHNTHFDINLGIKPKADVVDASVSLTDFGGWKAGRNDANLYRVCVNNVGTKQIVSGKLIVHLPKELENFEFSPLPVLFNQERAEWNLSDVIVDGSYCVDIKGTLKSQVPNGTAVKFRAHVELNGGADVDLNDNLEELTQNTFDFVGSNVKTTNKSGTFNGNDEPLRYRILFQNTKGNILNKLKIVDTLDQNLFIGAKGIYENTSHSSSLSHSYILLPNGNYQYVLTWHFNNINLPDSATNIDLSKGFADLKIYTDMRYMKQTSDICNRAFLYFDNSEALQTNKVCNTITNVGISSVKKNNVRLFPNPAKDVIHVGVDNKTNYLIISSLGQTVQSGVITSEEKSIDIQALPQGLYFLILEGYLTQKFNTVK